MALKIRSGAAWRDCANGNLRIKQGGVWRVANYCYIKSGGAWRDSGYRGFPNPPGSPYVTGWSYSAVNLAWSAAAAGGAPILHYHVVQTDAGGTWINQWWTANTFLNGIGVTEDQRTRFYVSSISTGGLESAWGGSVGVQIGHTEQGYYANEGRTRDWSNAVGFQDGLCRGETALVGVPNTVYMHTWRYILYLNFGGPYISKPTAQGNRQVYHVFTNAQFGTPFDINGNSVDFNEGFPNTYGGDSLWGIIINGVGWSDRAINTSQMLQGALYVYGIENYTVSVYYQTRAPVGNSYW